MKLFSYYVPKQVKCLHTTQATDTTDTTTRVISLEEEKLHCVIVSTEAGGQRSTLKDLRDIELMFRGFEL